MNTSTQAQLPTFQPVTRTNGPLTVSEHAKLIIAQHVRSGALDSEECTMIAIDGLAQDMRLTFRQAERLFFDGMI